MWHASACHTIEKVNDSAALGLLPIDPDSVQGRYRNAGNAADGARGSLGPACGEPDDEVLPHGGECAARGDGIGCDQQTLWQLAASGNRRTVVGVALLAGFPGGEVGGSRPILAGPTLGRGWSATAARGELRRLAAQAGVRRRFAPHQLRNAHAIEMAHEGIPPRCRCR